MREYETTFIVQPEITDEGCQALFDRIDGLIDKAKGVRLLFDDQGKRRLAYEIQKFQKGRYVTVNYFDSGSSVPDIERTLRLDESVLRFLTVRVAEEVTDIEGRKVAAQEEEKVRAERAAERAAREEEEAKARAAAEEARARQAAEDDKERERAAAAAKEEEAAEAAEAGEGSAEADGEKVAEAAGEKTAEAAGEKPVEAAGEAEPKGAGDDAKTGEDS